MPSAKSFATTPEYEALFERGYPWLRRLVTPHPDEADAERRAEAALDESDPGRYHVDWPAEVARRFVRALAHNGQFGIGFARHRKEGRVPEADAAIREGGPIDEKEGRQLVATLLGPDHSHYEFQVQHGVLLLEAMIGAEALVDAVLRAFEGMATLESKYSTRNYVAYQLGFVIRRLDGAARSKAEARVGALVEKKPESYTRDFLSYLFGGRAALESSGRKLGLYCVHFCDDPALVVKLAKESAAYVDAYHVRLAGDAVLEAIPKTLRKISAARLPGLIDELSRIASPKVDAILEELVAKKPVAKRAQAALDARAGKAPTAKVEPKPAKPPKPSDREVEARFEALSVWLASELTKVRGKKAKENAILDEAAQRYADLQTDYGQDPSEALVHFFGADGVGWKKSREPALLRLEPEPSDAELARWTTRLGELV